MGEGGEAIRSTVRLAFGFRFESGMDMDKEYDGLFATFLSSHHPSLLRRYVSVRFHTVPAVIASR